MARWSCSVSRTTSRDTPAGRGVIVVKTVRFDISTVVGIKMRLMMGLSFCYL